MHLYLHIHLTSIHLACSHTLYNMHISSAETPTPRERRRWQNILMLYDSVSPWCQIVLVMLNKCFNLWGYHNYGELLKGSNPNYYSHRRETLITFYNHTAGSKPARLMSQVAQVSNPRTHFLTSMLTTGLSDRSNISNFCTTFSKV